MVEQIFSKFQDAAEKSRKEQDKKGLDLIMLLHILEQQRDDREALEKELTKKNLSASERERIEEELARSRHNFENTLRNEYGIQDEDEIQKIMSDLDEIEKKIKEEFEARGFYTQQDLDDAIQTAQQDYLKNYRVGDPEGGKLTIEEHQKKYVYEDDPASPGKRRYKDLGSAATTNIKTNDRRAEVNSVLEKFARIPEINVNPDLMRGMWGVESTFGANLGSPTGCMGDWQFTRATFRSTSKNYDVAGKLEAAGYGEHAKRLRSYLKGELNEDLRMDPIISTMAAACYIKDVSKIVKVNPALGAETQEGQKAWAAIYAAYNVGPGNALKILKNMDTANVGSLFPRESGPNAFFYKDANGQMTLTGAEALQNYYSSVARRLGQYHKTFGGTTPDVSNTASFNSAVQNTQSYSSNLTVSSNIFTPTALQFHNVANGLFQPKAPIFSSPVNNSLLGNTFSLASTSITTNFGSGFGHNTAGFTNFWSNPTNG
ncbi:MAG: transglycosylase SLT domain-containing protein [Alphaproteobacteria bacterium]